MEKESARWDCVCDCGTQRTLSGNSLRMKQTKSCGCWTKELIKKSRTKHGMNKTGEYISYWSMKRRCLDVKLADYHNYGGRGIKVCDRWLTSFMNFFEDMGLRLTPLHSLDRIDVNGNYEKSNCRWATDAEQTRNTRANHWLEYCGGKMVITDWAIKLGVSVSTIKYRMTKGETFKEIVERFVLSGTGGGNLIIVRDLHKPIFKFEKAMGNLSEIICQRINKLGWTPEQAVLGKNISKQNDNYLKIKNYFLNEKKYEYNKK